MQSLQNLNRRGVKAEEFTFASTTVGHVATALVQTFRNQLIIVPNATVLKDELLKVKLRESSPGVTRLDHDRNGHDDQAVTIGMAAHTLISSQKYGAGAAFREYMRDRAAKRQDQTGEVLSKEDLDFRRHLRRMQGRSSRAERLRAVTAVRCQHRWRDGECVYGCGTREEQATLA
jgi:hypothetical protein